MKKFLSILAMLIFSATIGVQAAPKISVQAKSNLLGGGIASTMLIAGRRNNLATIEEEALSHLSNFDGDGYDGDGYDGYDGFGDPFLDFNGQGNSFSNEAQAGRVFTFTITNTSDTEQSFYICGGYKYKNQDDTVATGVMKQGAFRAIGQTSGNQFTASSSPTTVDEFRRFVELNPTRVLAFKLGVSDEAQIESMVIDVEQLSPFRKLGSDQIRPSVWKNENVFQNKIITVPAGFDLNNQIAISTNILPGKSVTFTIVCGAILNTAHALHQKRTAAKASRR